MIWKECLVLSVALCVLCEGRSAFSEVTVKKYYKGHHGEVSQSDHRTTENHEAYEKSHPSYEFSYKVIDPHTHDKKGQQETRDGDKVTGHYWLIQPDGYKRLVKYNVDGKYGFTADINYAIHDKQRKDDSEHDIYEYENKDHEKENDHKSEDKPNEDIKEEYKEEKQEDKEPEAETEEFESKKNDDSEKENKVDEKHHEEDQKDEKKSDESSNAHEKEEKDKEHEHTKYQEQHDLWSQIRDWDKLEDEEDKPDDSLTKTYTRIGETEHKDDEKHEVHDEHDKNEGNVWSWRKSYDVWEVKHHDGERKEENDKPIKEEHPEKRPEDDGSEKKGHRRNVGLRDYEYRGQPSYHMPIMRTKPIPYRRRIIVNTDRNV